MDSFQPFVYGLYDPAEAGHIRYVGMAPSRPNRPYQHATYARKATTDGSHLMRWIHKIQAEGREPSVMTLEQLPIGTSRSFLGFVESCYIKSLRKIGHRLTNANDGGWGGSNGPHSEESKSRMKIGWTSEVRKRVGIASRKRELGKKASDETRKRQSAAHLGKALSEKARIRIGEARKRAWDGASEEARQQHSQKVSLAVQGHSHPQTEETRAKISVKLAGRTMSQEWREKNALAQRGKKASEETRVKMSEAHKAIWAARRRGV